MATITDPTLAQFGALTKGGYAGREQKLYYDKTLMSGGYTEDATSDEAAAWVEIPHKNLTINDGTSEGTNEIGDYEFGTSGFKSYAGSFEYSMKKGTNTIYNNLKTAQKNGSIVRLLVLNDELSNADASGDVVPVIFTTSSRSGSGADPVNVTFNFKIVEAYDEADVLEVDQQVTVATGGTDPVAP